MWEIYFYSMLGASKLSGQHTCELWLVYILFSEYRCTLCRVHTYSMARIQVHYAECTCTPSDYINTVLNALYSMLSADASHVESTCTLWWPQIYSVMGARVLCDVCKCTMDGCTCALVWCTCTYFWVPYAPWRAPAWTSWYRDATLCPTVTAETMKIRRWYQMKPNQVTLLVA